jgi:hypothetical protein
LTNPAASYNYGKITNNKVILRLQEALEYIDLGVLECWSIGVLKEYFNPSAIALSKPEDLRAGGQSQRAGTEY